MFHKEDPQWKSVQLHRQRPFWSQPNKHPSFSEDARTIQAGLVIGMLPKAPTEHWGTMAFMSTVADGTNAHMAVTIEEGVHMLEGTRFECHAWQTPINPSKILHIEDKEEWRKFDNANPSRKRSKGKRQQILTPKVFKDRYPVRQQWNMNGECWTWADASAGAIFDDVYQSFLHEHALSDDHASCKHHTSSQHLRTRGSAKRFGCYRCTRWHAKNLPLLGNGVLCTTHSSRSIMSSKLTK